MRRTLDQARQQSDLAFLASGAEFAFGDANACPLTAEALAALHAGSPGVEAVIEIGLTARVLKLRVDGRCYAVKQARAECLVRNDDGRTSFLNELRRHAELRALRSQSHHFPGVIAPLFGSLRAGLIVSPWIAGAAMDTLNERALRQLLRAGCTLALHGFFEWDYSPGNVIDDGEQVWLFDFGYQYRHDPLTQFNSASHGDDVPLFHVAERIETRNAFGRLLAIELAHGMPAALSAFGRMKQAALDAYTELRAALASRGTAGHVLGWLDGITVEWSTGLGGGEESLRALYLKEGWRSHVLDLHDDLHGQTCTEQTLRRADWLIGQAQARHGELSAARAFFGDDASLPQEALIAHYRGLRAKAVGYLR